MRSRVRSATIGFLVLCAPAFAGGNKNIKRTDIKDITSDALEKWRKIGMHQVDVKPCKVTVGHIDAKRAVADLPNAHLLGTHENAASRLVIDPNGKGGPEIRRYLDRGAAVEKERIFKEVKIADKYTLLFSKFIASDPKQELRNQMYQSAIEKALDDHPARIDRRFHYSPASIYTLYDGGSDESKAIHRADATLSDGWEGLIDAMILSTIGPSVSFESLKSFEKKHSDHSSRPWRSPETARNLFEGHHLEDTKSLTEPEGVLSEWIEKSEGTLAIKDMIPTHAGDWMGKLYVLERQLTSDYTVPQLFWINDVPGGVRFVSVTHDMRALTQAQKEIERQAIEWRDGRDVGNELFYFGHNSGQQIPNNK